MSIRKRVLKFELPYNLLFQPHPIQSRAVRQVRSAPLPRRGAIQVCYFGNYEVGVRPYLSVKKINLGF